MFFVYRLFEFIEDIFGRFAADIRRQQSRLQFVIKFVVQYAARKQFVESESDRVFGLFESGFYLGKNAHVKSSVIRRA